MVVFEDLFIESKGEPIIYNGREIFLVDTIPVEHGEQLRLVMEEFNGAYLQGVSVTLAGILHVDDCHYKKGVTFWQEISPLDNVMRVDFKPGIRIKYLKKNKLEIHNVWDSGNGICHFGHNGSAMYKEEIPNGFRYFCNDGEPDDDFDDLIFRIERLGVQGDEE